MILKKSKLMKFFLVFRGTHPQSLGGSMLGRQKRAMNPGMRAWEKTLFSGCV